MDKQDQALKLAIHNYKMFAALIGLLARQHPDQIQSTLNVLTTSLQIATDEIKNDKALWDALTDLKRVLEGSVATPPMAPGGGQNQRATSAPLPPALFVIPGGKKD